MKKIMLIALIFIGYSLFANEDYDWQRRNLDHNYNYIDEFTVNITGDYETIVIVPDNGIAFLIEAREDGIRLVLYAHPGEASQFARTLDIRRFHIGGDSNIVSSDCLMPNWKIYCAS